MAASVNKVILVGNLGRDPESRNFPSGDMVTNVAIATSERWKDKQTGEPREHTEWHRLVFNGRLAEIAAQYLKKGMAIYVEGSIRTRKWQDQATGQDRYSTEVRVDSMQMLGSRTDAAGGEAAAGGGAQAAAPAQAPAQAPAPAAQGNPADRAFAPEYEDEIPF